MGCLSGCLVSSASIQKLFCGSCPEFKWIFDKFVGEKVVSLSYPLTSYDLPPVVRGFQCSQFSSVHFNLSVLSDSLQTHALQHARPPCLSPTPGMYSISCPLSQWCHPIISSSIVPFSSYLQSFPASGSFLMSLLFTSGGQGIGASASVLPVNIQDWFPLGLTSLISLQSKGLSRVFSNTTVEKHQFFGTQPFLWSNSHIIHDYWKNHSFD